MNVLYPIYCLCPVCGGEHNVEYHHEAESIEVQDAKAKRRTRRMREHEQREVYESLGLRQVRRNLGGVYYE